MGQAFISIAIENSADLPDGPATHVAVRRLDLPGTLMDSGATHLCLPADLVADLGLAFDREVTVKTATGYQSCRIFRNAMVEFEDRRTQCECIELPAGMPALLGAIPMEGLGVEPDLQLRRPRKLPMDAHGSFMSA